MKWMLFAIIKFLLCPISYHRKCLMLTNKCEKNSRLGQRAISCLKKLNQIIVPRASSPFKNET